MKVPILGSTASTRATSSNEAYFRCVIYLLTSILLSTGIFVLFQMFKRWEVHTFQAIVINYGVAAVMGWVLADGMSLFQDVQRESWVWVALIMGLLFRQRGPVVPGQISMMHGWSPAALGCRIMCWIMKACFVNRL